MAEGFTENSTCCINCKLGQPDLLMLNCGHELCSQRVHQIAQLTLQKDDCKELKCPIGYFANSIPCHGTISADLLEALLENDTELFEKLQPYAIQAEINGMSTIKQKSTSCPKCLKPASEMKPENFYGCCDQCGYMFCTNCRSDYHGFACNLLPLGYEDEPEYVESFLNHFDSIDEVLMNLSSLNFDPKQPSPQAPFDGPSDISTNSNLQCCICLTDVDAKDVVDFGCEHANSCQECTKSFFETLINSGDPHSLKCPISGCNTKASHRLIKSLVEKELFDKFDELLLNQALGDIPEVVYCPRVQCQRRVIAEPEYGYCEVCDFRFCTECNQSYHGPTPCGLSQEEMKNTILANNEVTKSEQKLQNEFSETLIRNAFKKCPKCNANIEKIDGCNHMTCTKCQTHFCWLCGEIISDRDPYSHFRSDECQLFPVPVNAESESD